MVNENESGKDINDIYGQFSINKYDEKYSINYANLDKNIQKNKSYLFYKNLLLNSLSKSSKKLNILDIGCGSGRYADLFLDKSNYTGIDISPFMIDQFYKNHLKDRKTKLLIGDFRNYDFQNNFFDYIYSIGVLAEYIPLNREILEKMHFCLKPKGKIIFTALDSKYDKPSLKFLILNQFLKKMPKTIRKLPFFNKYLRRSSISYENLVKILNQTSFEGKYEITNFKICDSLWKGAHHIVKLVK